MDPQTAVYALTTAAAITSALVGYHFGRVRMLGDLARFARKGLVPDFLACQPPNNCCAEQPAGKFPDVLDSDGRRAPHAFKAMLWGCAEQAGKGHWLHVTNRLEEAFAYAQTEQTKGIKAATPSPFDRRPPATPAPPPPTYLPPGWTRNDPNPGGD